jgi:fructuronate reductase
LRAAPGQDLPRYGAELIARFANPALNHRLIQIAMDGSQKLPQRWLEVLAINQQNDRQSPAILAGIAAWICHLRGNNGPVDDPRAAALAAAASMTDPVGKLFAENGLLASEWHPTEADSAAIAAHLA